ncbi:hypothetical protein DPMN_168120 [Dreissena polymorpha]|uniref:Uncharacterized protein n=1 Tax=Dreissena polymorpha TaxID=45954 RepID=A0A9D4F2P8_DREPO|nr:hypothetical protein DPMN_168120 [Dreissena polymorpha]
MIFTLYVGAISYGLSSVLVNEKTLTRSPKSNGGLTRGSGMIEGLRNFWTLSAPVKLKYNSAVHDFTDLTYTSNTHKKDLEKMNTKIIACSPYTADSTLKNIVHGIRFLMVSKSRDLSLEDVLSYKLRPIPPALFEEKNS